MSISYSVKYSDVIGKNLGLPELVVEAGKSNFANDAIKVCSAIGSALDNVSALKGKVEKAVAKAKRDAMLQVEDIATNILS